MAERTGEVQWFSSDRAFGVIRDAEGNDFYVIFEDVAAEPQELKPGERVRFEPGKRGNAAIACNVRRSEGHKC